MTQLKLTVALSHYDRHIPLFDGSAKAEGIDLALLEVGQSNPLRDGSDRHERMFQKGEFDLAEVSLSSYLVAKSRGMPFTAIPVFPRRLFSLSQMWVNVDAGVHSPKDLAGRKAGLSTFQTTLSVLAKGDLQSEYDVPWREIDWCVTKKETFDFKPQEVVRGSAKIRRLFPDAKQEEIKYFKKNGFYPIMHVVAFKDEVLKKNPFATRSVMEAFQRAKEACSHYYDDPNWSRLAWVRHLYEEERSILGEDPWPYGVSRNRANLERFMGYSLDQGLMSKKLAVEELFHKSTWDT